MERLAIPLFVEFTFVQLKSKYIFDIALLNVHDSQPAPGRFVDVRAGIRQGSNSQGHEVALISAVPSRAY
jgi:hypothetical protein